MLDKILDEQNLLFQHFVIMVYEWEGVLILFESRRRALKKIECTENA